MNLLTSDCEMNKTNITKVVLMTECRLLGFGIKHLLQKNRKKISVRTFYDDSVFFDYASCRNEGVNALIIDADYLSPVQVKVISHLAVSNFIPHVVIISSLKNNNSFTHLISGEVCHISKSLNICDLLNLLERALNISSSSARHKAISGANFITNRLNGSPLLNGLTPCEESVIKMIFRGMSVSDISKSRGRSIKTISGQKLSALKKLGLKESSKFIKKNIT